MPVVPATWEAEAGEPLEPGGRGYSELIVPLHSSLGDRVRLRPLPPPKKSKTKQKKEFYY